MDETRRTYDFQGQVTISSQEYADLVHDLYEARLEKEKEHNRWYEEYRKNSDLDDSIKELESKVESQERAISHYRDFVNSSDDIKVEYKLYLKNKEIDE